MNSVDDQENDIHPISSGPDSREAGADEQERSDQISHEHNRTYGSSNPALSKANPKNGDSTDTGTGKRCINMGDSGIRKVLRSV